MKKNRKLRRYITRSLGLAALAIICVYSILVEFALIKGLEESASFDLRLMARDFSLAYQKNPQAPLPKFPRLNAYLGEKDLPGWFRKKFSPADLPVEKLTLDEPTAEEYEKELWIFHIVLPHELPDGKRLYLIKSYTEKDDIPEAFIFSENLEIIILGTGIIFILLLMTCARFLFRKVASSLEVLSGWAGNLDNDNLEHPRPDFKFREIDQLADLIQNAVTNLHQALVREHRFLRNASHELRTPIAVLRSNMDLLERVKSDLDDSEKAIYQRIRRAVDNMHRLTETLLWLSRKEDNMPAPEPVDMGELVDELVGENRYLLNGKNVELNLDMVAIKTTLPRVALGIALGNLIRNAFQYTNHGRIEIRVTPISVAIINTEQAKGKSNSAANDYGFGLGLTLVEQISQKLNILYENKAISGGHEATLIFSHSDFYLK